MRTRILAGATGFFLLVACGGSPTGQAPQAGGGETAGGADGGAELESSFGEVLAEVEGLEGQQRRDKLIELASQEDDANLYTSFNEDEANQLLDAYEEDTGLTVSLYRAGSEDVRNRLVEEAGAGFAGADVVETNGPEMVILADEGIFEPLDSPVQDDLVDEAVEEGWTASRFNVFTVAWNTERVGDNERPTAYQDLADDGWNGRMAMEIEDYDWYWALRNYLVGDGGMSEDEADEYFRQVADGAAFTSGHSTMRQLLIAGEYDLVTSDYSYGIAESKAGGAPVEWQPSVEPLFARPNGVALVRNAPNPAAALAFAEWLLSDGQDVLNENNLDPTRQDLQEFGDADVRIMDIHAYLSEADEFAEQYEELARLGEKVDE
ncbi:MAG: ABC transporter substrate-binding protein [Egibacteraceae bacterium]